ncbi:hypothetical protein WCD74_02600 [Actinomycetospora sp. OC33-EN08]|uniref:Uncharacterized protein n=1 Tax=Actinomycetospora aurantiaca TaxID=3129233 RepID=A0ABU8MHP0_9PSEU
MYEVGPIDDLARLPDDLAPEFAELRTALELSPWTVGRPYLESNPTGMRVETFGRGRALLVFGISEYERRVNVFDLVVL